MHATIGSVLATASAMFSFDGVMHACDFCPECVAVCAERERERESVCVYVRVWVGGSVGGWVRGYLA